ncbi:protocadherin Fat 1-like isoform X3 [Mya arenaria]|uniref:protocadherin Fat 1-like isoform X3 n=1 Tax=Mya arenaria TaxID=6604 RepID=UPI0022E76F46|nr:protocadherin Fat 1-like isoform X3 [Mya arenaria]
MLKGDKMALLSGATLIKWLIWVTTFCLATVAMAAGEFHLTDLHFTKDIYNVSVPENSLGKTFVTPLSKMGIYLPENKNVKITYHLVDSEDDLFKVEDHQVGDFSFLLIRTHSGSYGRLNREFRSEYRLKVKALAESNGMTFETSTDVNVFVSDVNDLQPLFDSNSYEVTIAENMQLHESIMKVSAYDGDDGINAQIYYSFADKTNVFAIHPTSGVITLTRPLNYFLQKEYQLKILASDRGPDNQQNMRKRPASLTLHVKQVNFFPPDISVKKIPNVMIPGDNKVVLAIVNVQDRDIGTNGLIQSVSIFEGSLDGLISLEKGEQDTEYRVLMKPSTQQSIPMPGFSVTVQATDQGDPPLQRNETFYISVYDAKTIPKFSNTEFHVQIMEIAPVNTPVTFVTTVKSLSHFDVRYEIVAGNTKNLFKINHISGLITTSALLDAEKVSNVQLKVVVYDAVRKHHRNSDSCIVNITITDHNDNTPEFHITDNVSEIYIQENLPVGTSIFTIGAIDNDKNENGRLSFSIVNELFVPFDIEPFSGVLKTKAVLDYETMRHSYKLNIRVADWGTPFLQENEMLFTINLQDSNDNEPHFEMGECSGFVSRHAPVGTEIHIVPAIDFDINDIIQYSIISSNENGCFSINGESARISLNCSLANLPENRLYIQVLARDGIHNSDPISIDIELIDEQNTPHLPDGYVNINCKTTDIYQRLQSLVTLSHKNNEPTDFGISKKPQAVVVNTAPEFNDSVPTSLEISEGLAVGSVIARLEAVDTDSGYNGELVYVIHSGDIDGFFKVDMFTGGLMIMSHLDRELRDEYQLVIVVSDLGSPALSANVSVSIKIIDENDNPPVFEQNVYKATISENINVNATVTQVSATDKDTGKNAFIQYAIVSSSDLFSIDPNNGIIRVHKPLDREKYPVYTVLVRASDKGEKLVSLSSTATVLVELTDVNDVVPEFTPNLYSVRIREDLPLGSVVTVVTASDTDEGKHGEVSYQLVYGEDFFEIDSETGVIRIIKSLDYEVQQVHNISVRAQDGGIPPLISVCFINIEVVDVNENLLAPVFENFYTYGYISENEPVGTTVMFVKAYDPDGDGVTYSIRDGSGLGRFNIDSNGTIMTSQVLDRETATHYWLTVYAQDHGLVPLHTRLEVYIEVRDVNDHIPLPYQPVYYGSVRENDNNGFVTQVQAFDLDRNLNQSLHYEITRYDPLHFFQIDPKTGVISSTGKPFDREQQAVHQLEVTISDQGEPPLKYGVRVFIDVEDDNDNRPVFNQRIYRMQFLATAHQGEDIPVFQVLAWDDDAGENGRLSFEIRTGKDDSRIFNIHPETGMIYATDDLSFGDIHHFVVRAFDHGDPKPRRSTVKIRIEVVERLKRSPHPPRFAARSFSRRVMEDDRVGHLVDLFQAEDPDRDNLFYTIVDGDPGHQFYIGLDAGSLMVARPLDWETTPAYNLTIHVTDGVNSDTATVYIEVIDVNDNKPLFTTTHYEGSFPESAPIGTTLLKVKATDDDNNKLIYSLPDCCNSQTTLDLFDVAAETGAVLVHSPLDREVATQHNLTVMVSDQGLTPNWNYTRVTINVVDHNDHPPMFLATEFQGRVFETAAIGTSILQVAAVDHDRGHNAEITYSILTGNIGGTFTIDRLLGTISVAKEIDKADKTLFELVVMATDQGDTPLSASTKVTITVTISDNAPPRFEETQYMAELLENQPVFTNVFTISAICRSSLIYTIIGGNDRNIFSVNPNSGVVFTKKQVDFETDHSFNLTIKATSVIHSSAMTHLLIHVIDENDNVPEFLQHEYVGNVTELAEPGTIVLDQYGEPLVIRATDKDSDLNALLIYEIRDEYAKKFITIDHNTGAIRTVAELDREAVEKIELSVEVWDMGKPQHRTRLPARVTIYVDDVNDTPPKFSTDSYTAHVFLPTFSDVIVVQTIATDDDYNSKLRYRITEGNSDKRFRIDKNLGAIYIDNAKNMEDSYKLNVQVSDGVFTALSTVDITVAHPEYSPFTFTRAVYEASVMENILSEETLIVIMVADRALNQQYSFSLLNGKGMFEVGLTSGVLTTTGVVFDREEIALYNLIVEVHRQTPFSEERAHAVVKVTVEDENDNAPMFVQQPYHSVLVYDAPLGHIVKQVTAVDRDAGQFGHVTYSLKRDGDHGNRFAIAPETGEITVLKHLQESDVGQKIVLTVSAEDGDIPSKTTETSLQIVVISQAYPVFDQLIYRATIPEYIPRGSAVATLSANSPTGQKLIYTIMDGNYYGDFDVDFNIGVVTVHGVLTRAKPSYNLTIQAIELMSGLTATSFLMITVQDVNNEVPTFTSHLYRASISEAASIGASVLTVLATDPEPGDNGLVHYRLVPSNAGDQGLDWFHIGDDTGTISTRKFLDREDQPEYKLLVVASDSGIPALSATATVIVTVTDLNDNAPTFNQRSYHCTISDQIARGQLVTKVSATDLDSSSRSKLRYAIIAGNDRQTFDMEPEKGIISLSQQRIPDLYLAYNLNISVSDGVFSNFARVNIKVQTSNNNAPRFDRLIYVAEFPENYGEGMLVTQVRATDEDDGTFGMIRYSISSDEMQQYFRIDADTGEMYSVQVLDRERQSVYSVPVAVSDNGGRMTFTTVHISIRDQNDNVPQFLAQEYKQTVLDSTPLNSTIMVIQAEDKDSGVNGEIVYEFSPGTSARVQQLFHLHPDTGVITLSSSLKNSVDEIFQFFVQASDKGDPPMKNNVPVNMWVTDNDDAQPVFSQPSYSFFMLENEPVSTVIATVKAMSFSPLEYIIVPGYTKSSNSPARFSIDSQGKVRVAAPLDMETNSVFILTVQAQTLSSPPLVQEATINIRLMDVNDNYPYFESNPYQITVPENSEAGIDIVQVVAHDMDKSSRFIFSFGDDVRKYSHQFSIDSTTGVITLLSELDRESQELYNLTVWVKDSDSPDALQNFTIVQVKVMDCNDNPPIFSREHYQAAVNEDAYEGTILMTLTTVDKDLTFTSETHYYITEGDPEGKFRIRADGDVFVNGQLDRERVPRYKLTVAATDGAFVTTATLTIDILDANDNTPVCHKPVYDESVSEDVTPSWVISTLKASDADEYGSLRYELTGDGAQDFYLEPNSGVLTAARHLDRETIDRYQLTARAVDIGGKYCSMDIRLTITDVNDNSPVIQPIQGPVSVSEGAVINTLIYRVSASDADLGNDRQITFSLTGNPEGVFKIDEKSGLIQLAKRLDREKTDHYTITVHAADKGTPQLTSEVDIEITVTDENDNPPEFEQTTYWASVREDAAIGQYVATVRASSLDTGVNAQISFFIQSGNDKDKFTVEEDTGIIRTAGYLDHETVPGYVLTIQAQDHGEVPLTNTAYVQINVTDVNDNPPVFLQKEYSGMVREDAQIGSRVLQVLTADLDSDPLNKAVNFSLVGGDSLQVFDIHRTDGYILVRNMLNREAISSYTLQVRASNYHLTAETVVNIEILDANDCPPSFSQENYTVFVQMNDLLSENKKVTSCILKFEVSDDDLDPNGAPFTFDLIGLEQDGKFRVDEEGNLCIAGGLNRQVTATYLLTVRAFDSGTPAMYSDVKVMVDVIEESTYSPEVSNLDVYISSYMDEFPGGVIGTLKAVDGDTFDTLDYTVVSMHRNLFDIDKKDGRVIAFAGLDAGAYNVNVSVTDGKFTSYGNVNVDVTIITEEMIANAITIQFADMSPQDFFKIHKKDFVRILKRVFNVRTRDIAIISIQNSDSTNGNIAERKRRDASSNLDVLFAVNKGVEYIPKDRLKRKVAKLAEDFTTEMGVVVVKVISDICERGMCEGGTCVGYVEFDKDSLAPVFMDGGSFVSAKHRYTYECECPNGNIGDNCLPNPTSCSESPCPVYKECVADPQHGYQCVCPDGLTGKRCEKDLDNKCDNTNCHRGDSPMTFAGNSYAKWTLLNPIDMRLTLSMRIKTIKETASLMFAKGRVDYSILELVNGMVQYRFDCGSGEGLVLIPNHISDGKWHTIMVERHKNFAELFLDGQFSAITTAPGINDVLNLDNSDVYFGAEVETYSNGYIDVRKGFRGCIEDIQLHNVRLPVTGSNAVALSQQFEHLEFSCKDSDFIIDSSNVCSSFPCMNGGKCEATSANSYMCRCGERFQGLRCEIDKDPCQRMPCLNNGVCANLKGVPNDFQCTCPGGFLGRRCEYGKYCQTSPCQHAGTCIEGPTSYTCRCAPGYAGARCESMEDMCLSNPCENAGTCVQMANTYMCNCSEMFSGVHCEEKILLPRVTSSNEGIEKEEIYIIVGIVCGLIVVVIAFVLVRVWRRKKNQRHHNVTAGVPGDGNEVYLNLHKSDKHNYKAENILKIDNMNNKRKTPPSPQPPPVPERPASYTPSARDSINTLNNFDQLRNCNYGSAADDLESIPNISPYNSDFLQTFAQPGRSIASVQPTMSSLPSSDNDSLQKEPWERACQNILQNYISDKHSDKMSKLMPVGTVMPMSHLEGQGQETSSVGSLPISESEDDQQETRKKRRKVYNWDTYDLAPEKSLPNISEVPAGECPDSPASSGHHSNESNTHINNIGRHNGIGQYTTNGEFTDSEYVGDSEYAEHDMEEPPELPNYEELLAEQSRLLDDYEMPRNIHVHPSYYLPLNSSFTSAHSADEPTKEEIWPPPPAYANNNVDTNVSDSSHTTSSEDDNDSVLHYGFPVNSSNINRLSMITTDSELNVDSNRLSAAFTTDSEMNDIGYSRGSIVDDMSEISGLCEIEDSEANNSDSDSDDENTPLHTQKIHTEV